MKFSELSQVTYKQSKDTNSYVICNSVINDEDAYINKSIMPIEELASKNEVNALVEQNSKLVEIISSFVARLQTIETDLSDIKNQLDSSKDIKDIGEITEMLNDISQRLDNNLIE